MLESQVVGIGTGELDRLVIALSGAVAIWLGYRLFLSLSLAEKAMGKLSSRAASRFSSRAWGPGSCWRCSGPGCSRTGFTRACASRRTRRRPPRRPSRPGRARPAARISGLSFDGVFEGRLSDATGTRPARTVLRRQVDRVTGVYSDGVGRGDISGIVEEDTLLFVWQSGGSRGRGRMQASPGGVEFSGTWGHGDASAGAGTWTGARRGR